MRTSLVWPEVVDGQIIPGTLKGRDITITWCPDCQMHPVIAYTDTGEEILRLSGMLYQLKSELLLQAVTVLFTQDPEKREPCEVFMAKALIRAPFETDLLRWPRIEGGKVIPGQILGRKITFAMCPDCGTHASVVDAENGRYDWQLTEILFDYDRTLFAEVTAFLETDDDERLDEQLMLSEIDAPIFQGITTILSLN